MAEEISNIHNTIVNEDHTADDTSTMNNDWQPIPMPENDFITQLQQIQYGELTDTETLEPNAGYPPEIADQLERSHQYFDNYYRLNRARNNLTLLSGEMAENPILKFDSVRLEFSNTLRYGYEDSSIHFKIPHTPIPPELNLRRKDEYRLMTRKQVVEKKYLPLLS